MTAADLSLTALVFGALVLALVTDVGALAAWLHSRWGAS
jgi:hypothetical protein